MNLQLVPKHYLMNPSTEKLLRSGGELENGMVILTENMDYRADTRDLFQRDPDQETMAKALKWNRWMRVIDLEIDLTLRRVRFVGEFEDGSRMLYDVTVKRGWFAKLNNDARWDDDYEKYMKGSKPS